MATVTPLLKKEVKTMKGIRSLIAAALVFSGFIAIGMWIAWSTLHS
jgi:hypothetical protein